MAIRKDAIDDKTRAVIISVLRQKLERSGFRTASVRAGGDHDGDPVLFIEAHFDLVADPIDPAITSGITAALCTALEEVGETRFPHIRYDFHDDQVIVERKRKRKRA